MLVLVGRVELRPVVGERRGRQGHGPPPRRRFGPVVDRERVHQVRVPTGHDEQPARRRVNDRRAADAVVARRDARGPHRQPRRLVEREDVRGRPERSKREEDAGVRRPCGGLAASGRRRATRGRGAILEIEHRRSSLILRVSVRGERRVGVECRIGRHRRDRRLGEARLGERGAAVDVAPALEHRLRTAAGAAVAARSAPARAGSRRAASAAAPAAAAPTTAAGATPAAAASASAALTVPATSSAPSAAALDGKETRKSDEQEGTNSHAGLHCSHAEVQSIEPRSVRVAEPQECSWSAHDTTSRTRSRSRPRTMHVKRRHCVPCRTRFRRAPIVAIAATDQDKTKTSVPVSRHGRRQTKTSVPVSSGSGSGSGSDAGGDAAGGCDGGLKSCNGQCVDTGTDPQNCGGRERYDARVQAERPELHRGRHDERLLD